MANNGAAREYKFGTKNNWRRHTWNRIRDRVAHPRDAVVVYLAGRDNLDAEIAQQKGFAASNFIAVERDRKVTDALRAAGQNTINGDFVHVMAAWSRSVKCSVVVGDFCCGLHAGLAWDLTQTVLAPQFRGTVFAFNWLRGRDPSFNEFRKVLLDNNPGMPKHRGHFFYASIVFFLASTVINHAHAMHEEGGGSTDLAECAECRAAHPLVMENVWAWCKKSLRPEYSHYKSTSGQVFDSIVITGDGFGEMDYAPLLHKETLRGVVPKVAAALAVRTMKASRTGPYATERRAA
jgi:hypothetical protein